MLKWIAIPAVSLLAMLPTASNAQLACAIPTATVNALQAKLAIVVTRTTAEFSVQTRCGPRLSIAQESSVQ